MSGLLLNGDFEAADGLAGWHKRGGEASVETTDVGSRVAVLVSQTTATKWLYQTAPVSPGGWYEARARLQPGGAAEAGFVRVAWYASADGSGRQIATADSPPAAPGASAPVELATGALQAPSSARSAQVRLALRPAGAGRATLIADDAWFDTAPAPTPTATPSPTPTATPTPTPSATPEPSTTPSPTATARAASTPPAAVSAAPVLVSAAAAAPPGEPSPIEAGAVVTAYAIPLRITALLPDPGRPGPDARFEWVELTNVGRVPLSIGGYELRDNARALTLPEIVLPAGGSVVIAGAKAEVGSARTVRLVGGLFNGLANAGDRVVLLTADGAIVDALSYGDDASGYGPPIAAPPTGEVLRRRFTANGRLVAVEISGAAIEPAAGAGAAAASPAEPTSTSAALSRGASAIPAATAEAARPAADEGGGAVQRAAWIALAALALGALSGIGALRLRELLDES